MSIAISKQTLPGDQLAGSPLLCRYAPSIHEAFLRGPCHSPTSVPDWNLTRWKPPPVLPPLQTADASKLSRA
jgi:hypothetical protein